MAQLPKPTHSFDAISNHYGGLEIFEFEGSFYWSIDEWGSEQKIPEYLYRSLERFATEGN